MQAELRKLMDNDQSEGYQGMSFLAEIRKLRTAVTYVETQSVESLRRYFERLKEAARSSGASKADQRLVSEPKIREAMRKAQNYDDLHPKFRRTRMLLAETLGIENGERVIVFTESRDTAETLVEFLAGHFSTRKFVGQSDTDGSEGMTQTEQQETLNRFRAGEFEVLVSTSVAEEGLDVPEVDLVLFYEPVPTAIRAIQRKGRTGRQAEGRVVVLLANDTRDEAYFWKARNDQKRMKNELQQLKSVAGELAAELDQTGLDDYEDVGGATSADGGQAGLDAFAGEAMETAGDDTDEEGGGGRDGVEGTNEDGDDRGAVATPGGDSETVEIVADQRELDSTIARDLSTRDGIETRLETLAVGDYVLSDRVVVERKTVSDFLDTLTGGDRSMFEQVGDAARNYARPERNVHEKSINGALASLAVDFGASVMYTGDEGETADLLETIATREQDDGGREVSVHGEKQARTLPEQQEYVVSSVAEVGPVTARSLLDRFGSVEAVMTATHEELLTVAGIGDVTAERIREVVGSSYES